MVAIALVAKRNVKKTKIDNEFFGAFAIYDNLGGALTLKYPTVYAIEDKRNEKYLLGFPLTAMSDSTDYKHIRYGSYKGIKAFGLVAFYCFYSDFKAAWFYADNTLAFSGIADYFGSQAITAYISVNGSPEIETLGLCDKLFYEGNQKAKFLLIFENVELNDKDKFTIRFENAFTLGYSVTYEFSINANGYGGGKPLFYQASVIPWQDNIGVKLIGNYYID